MSTRQLLIAGNWKMNGGPYEAAELLDGLKSLKKNFTDDIDVLVFPPFVSLSMAVKYLHSSDIQVGAQNLYYEDNGAFTGEISASMLAESGCNYVLVGHSERREYFGETDEMINKKIKKAMAERIVPIICVGEKLETRKNDGHFKHVSDQIRAAYNGLDSVQALDTVIAYEPVWAIGTGVTATPEQAQEMHAFIRQELEALFGTDTAGAVRILYGGSMKPENAEELLTQEDVDGGLVGGASLSAKSFAELIVIAENLS